MRKTKTMECKVHGETVHSLRNKKNYFCNKCNVDYVMKYKRQRKEKAVAYKGGSCVFCGYNKCLRSLDFHHIDATQKEFNIGRRNLISWEKCKAELDKCILVCGNCHGEIHEGILDVASLV